MDKVKFNLPYFFGKETESFQFFKLPKIFFKDSRLKGLSSDSKLLYSFFLDRVALSVGSGWSDKEGRIYIIFTNEEACDLLGKSKKTITKIMGELDDETGLGLIERKRQGLGKPDLIYVKNLTALEIEVPKIDENPKKSCPELPLKSGKKDPYRGAKTTPLEGEKFPSIKTDNIKTEGLKPILLPNPQTTSEFTFPELERTEGWTDLNKQDKIALVTEELKQAYQNQELSTLLYHYRTCESKLSTALYVLTRMAETDRMAKLQDDNSNLLFFFRTRKLYVNALTAMLTENGLTKVKTGHISYSKVLDKLLNHIILDEGEIRLDSIVECTLAAYMEANKVSEIISPFPYMKSCIWTTLCEGNIRHEAENHRRYG